MNRETKPNKTTPKAVVTIDGPAGAGKSTVARLVADRLGLGYLDTGAMYRTVALAVMKAGIEPNDNRSLVSLLPAMDVNFDVHRVYLDGIDITEEIREPSVNKMVSLVAANAMVRSALVGWQRRWLRRHGGGVLDGRDTGTVVAPHAAVKIFLTATVEERARRRSAESGQPIEEVENDIKRRDEADISRDIAPLVKAPDAIVVDSSETSIEDVVNEIVVLARLRLPELR